MLTSFLPAQCLTLRMTLVPLKGQPEKTYGCQKNLLFVPPTPEDGVPCLSAPVGGEEPNFHTWHQLTNQVGFTWTNPTFPVLVIFHFLGSTEPLLTILPFPSFSLQNTQSPLYKSKLSSVHTGLFSYCSRILLTKICPYHFNQYLAYL